MLAHLLPHVSICERAQHFPRVGDKESSIVDQFGNSGIMSEGLNERRTERRECMACPKYRPHIGGCDRLLLRHAVGMQEDA